MIQKKNKKMDERIYHHNFVNDGWCFIALTATEASGDVMLMKMEEWKTKNNEVLFFNRYGYSKQKAVHFIKKKMNGHMNMMDGIDLYCITKNGETICNVYVLDANPNSLGITYKKDHFQVKKETSYKDLKKKIIKFLSIEIEEEKCFEEYYHMI